MYVSVMLLLSVKQNKPLNCDANSWLITPPDKLLLLWQIVGPILILVMLHKSTDGSTKLQLTLLQP